MIKKIAKLIFAIILCAILSNASFGQARIGLYVQNNYNNSFKKYRTDTPNVGVYGYGIGAKYYLSDLDNKLQFSLGVEYNRTGYKAVRDINTSYVEPDLLAVWGPAPYKFTEKVYYGYWTLSYELSYFLTKVWYAGATLSLDYPRTEKEIQIFESEQNKSTYETEGTYGHEYQYPYFVGLRTGILF